MGLSGDSLADEVSSDFISRSVNGFYMCRRTDFAVNKVAESQKVCYFERLINNLFPMEYAYFPKTSEFIVPPVQ